MTYQRAEVQKTRLCISAKAYWLQEDYNYDYTYSGTPYKGHLTTRGTFLVPFWYFIMLNDPSAKDTSIKRTHLLVRMVSVIEGFHCILISHFYWYVSGSLYRLQFFASFSANTDICSVIAVTLTTCIIDKINQLLGTGISEGLSVRSTARHVSVLLSQR